MSSVMRRRSDVMESSFALVGFAANSFSTRSQRRLRILPLKTEVESNSLRSREVTLGTSRYQIPRSGLVQSGLCRIRHKLESLPLPKKVLIPGAGHWIQQERPIEVNDLLIEFLASL